MGLLKLWSTLVMTKRKIVIIYDFDKTLTAKDMQEYGLLQDLGYEEPHIFWREVDAFNRQHHVDPVLGYMLKLQEIAKKHRSPLTRSMLIDYGKKIEFLPGVEEWFKGIHDLSVMLNVTCEHVIISSGLSSMIYGSSIAKHINHIYGCEYVYNDNGEAIWPAVANNYTMKTQFVSRIHKEAHDLSDHITVNQKSSQRPVPYSHMIFLGDGMSDVATMRMIHEQGGLSLALYHGQDAKLAQDLISDGRVHGAYEANYHVDSPLFRKVTSYITYLSMP